MTLGLAGALPNSLEAQHPVDPVAIMVPVPADRDSDSSFVVDFASDLFNRISGKPSRLFMMIEHCRETGYCDAILDDTSAYRLAESLGAYLYVTGSFDRSDGNQQLHLRIMATGQRGGVSHQASSLTVIASRDLTPGGLASLANEVLADTLANVVRAAREARSCWTSIGEDDLEEARGFAFRAYGLSRNHPSASMCLAMVYEQAQVQDSVTWALERAVAGDSMLSRAWRRLGGVYLRGGDTAQAIVAHSNEVRGDPGNVDRRARVVRQMEVLGRRDVAVRLLRAAAEKTTGDSEARLTLTEKCLQYEMWECALHALTDRYELDPSLVGDTLLYYQVIGLAQATDDTAALERWTEEAVTRVRESGRNAWEHVAQLTRDAEQIDRALHSFQMVRGDVLRGLGEGNAALAVYRDIWQSDPQNALARVAAARLLTEAHFTTAGPVSSDDSVALHSADSLLSYAGEHSEDPDVHQAIAQSYFDIASRLVQHRIDPQTALIWLEKSIESSSDRTVTARAHAYSALTILYLVEALDARIRTERTCDLVDREARLLASARRSIGLAGTEFPQMLTQIQDGIRAYEELMPEIRRALSCRR